MNISILDYIKENNAEKYLHSGHLVVALSVGPEGVHDAIVMDQFQNDKLYLKKITDLQTTVDKDKDRVFLLSTAQWERMTHKNLMLGEDRNGIISDNV